jgi:hypothetical protein
MKLRIWPLTISAAVTAVLLFGGWFSYRQFGVLNPLDRVAASAPGVLNASVETNADNVKIDVKLKPNADIAQIYKQVKTDGEGALGGKKLELTVSGASDSELEKAWGYALFDVAEAMENRTYTDVRDAMDKLTAKFPGLQASTEIDEDNVYVTLRKGEHSKFVILPRKPVEMEVWPNA